jgi:HD-GYP domain-containing protein (c-di-GMP phosphodiesterase class II)
MEEKPPSFTVTDRRKFTLEGEPRDESETPTAQQEATERPAESTARVINFPKPEPKEETKPVEAAQSAGKPEEKLAGPSAQESAEQHAAYQQSSRDIDNMLRQANPGMGAAQETTFEHVIQSIYLSAMIAMGAGTEQGQQPRIDIIGARHSIDMLAVLQEKTKGNLTDKEQQLLQNALFDLRMMFVEITNAIAKSAQQPPPKKK